VTKVSELLAAKRCLSVELWPPRSEEAARRLRASLARLERLRPDFASITYGAGGSTRDRTHELVVAIQHEWGMTAMAHVACAGHRREELVEILERYRAAGVENVLALRGDPPLWSGERPPAGALRHASELVELAREVGDFCVAVAVHPEVHPESSDPEADRRLQAEKLRRADLGITQMFFRVEEYLRLVEDLSSRGVTRPVVPGVMPVVNARSLLKMAALSGTSVPASLAQRVEAVEDRPEEVRRVGVEVATELCAKLLAEGVPGLHFFTMNQVGVTEEVCDNLGLLPRGR
jgi:methylenetetrahydrofolate reductase (NADPH)